VTLSLIAVTLAFTALVVWVYWPANRESFEKQARIVFEPGEGGDHE
jgi:cbb3-type cytochrome oxidase subunit 3